MQKIPSLFDIQKVYAIKFQSSSIHQELIKMAYHVCRFLFSIPIVYLVLIIQSQLLVSFTLRDNFIERISVLSKNYSLELIIVSILMIIINTGVLISLYAAKSQIIVKIQICYLLFVQSFSNVFITFIFQLLATNFSSSYALSFILIFLCIQKFLLTFLIQFVFISASFQPINPFAHKYTFCCSVMTIVQKISLGIFLLFLNSSNKDIQILKITILLFLFLTQSLKIWKSINFFYYYSSFEQNILNVYSMVVIWIILMIVTLYQIFQIELVRQNFIILVITMSIFALMSAYNYITFQQFFLYSRLNELYFKDIEEILQENLQIIYLIILFQLQKDISNQYSALIVTSLKKQHQIQCKKSHCYCQKDQPESHGQNIRQKYEIFLKGFCLDVLQRVQENQYENAEVLLKTCYFRFQKFKSYAIAIGKLNSFNLKKNPQNFIKIEHSLLIQKINQYILEKNRGTINSQLPLLFQTQLEVLQKLILQDIKLKDKKWKYITKGLCKTNDIQQNIQNQIQILHKMEKIKMDCKQKFSKNSAFNFLMIYYFGQIVFLKDEIQQFVQNLKEVLIPVRITQVVSNKQLFKNIFHQRCSLIQSNILDSVSFDDFTLNIQNCNSNVLNVFGYEKSFLLNKSSQILYPFFLYKEQKRRLFNFIYQQNKKQQKGLKQLQQLKQATQQYFLNNLHQVFSGLCSVKLIVRADCKISLIMLIFKKHEENIILLNQQQEIQAIGSVWKQNFGHVYNGLPLYLFLVPKNDKKDNLLKALNEKESINIQACFIEMTKFCEQWNQITEQWTQFVKKFNNKYYSDHQSQLQNQKKDLINKMKNQIKQKILKNECNRGNIESFTQLQINLNKDLTQKQIKYQVPKVKVSLSIKNERINNKKYISILITQIQNKYDCEKSVKNFKTTKDMTLILKVNSQQKKTLIQELNDSQTTQKQCIKNDVFQREDESYEKQNNQKEAKAQKKIVDTASSINSSNTSRDTGYVYHKFIQFCRILFVNPQQIQDERLNIFTFGALILGICLISLSFFSNYYLSTGLYENQDIFLADGAVSDNMQLAQYVYNRGMNFLQLKNKTSEISSLSISANYERNNLYDLMTLDLQQYLTAATKLTKTKFYQYIRIPLKWYQNYESTEFIQIQTNQFLQYFVYLSKRIQDNIINPKSNSNFQIMDSLKMMNKNFPQLKRINHFNLYLYQDMSNSSMQFIGNLSFLLLGCHIILTLFLLIWLYRQQYFRIQQKFQCFSIYKIIPLGLSQLVSQFYINKYQTMKKQKDLKSVQKQFQRTTIYLPQDMNSIGNTKKAVFLQNKQYISYKFLINLFILIILNGFFVGMVLNYQNLFQPIKKMMVSVNSLMDSQNYMIQAFCDLKAKYLIQNATSIPVSFFDDILQTQKQHQVLFNKIAIDSLQLFTSFDSAYKSDFIILLLNNTCQLSKNLVSSQLYQKCKTYPKYKLLDDGVITGMNFFQRKIRQSVQKIKALRQKSQNVSAQQRQQVLALINGVDFRQIDEYNIFMFRMYQTTQARIYTSLDSAILMASKKSLILVIFYTCIIILGFFAFLLINYKIQKKSLSKLYISFLLVPSPLIRLIKGFARQMERCLQYKRK